MEHEESFEPLFVPLGPRRMQDTILDFAQPALKRLPPDYTLEELRAMLQIPARESLAANLRRVRRFRGRDVPRADSRPVSQVGHGTGAAFVGARSPHPIGTGRPADVHV